VKKTHDYIHHYRGYWSDEGMCRIRVYQEDGQAPVVICSQLPDNTNTSVTNMAKYSAAEIIQAHSLLKPLERVMNSAGKPHRKANISVSSVLRQSPVFRISKLFLSKLITATR
jgi:hypothetical protein